jgi:bis(5'-nucleosyl)-tetraphosphatase (symmetrical)
MSLYCIGDVQGCNAALGHLLDEIGFSPSRDTVFMLGDLVNRGPDSSGVLRRLMKLGAAARCLLGNHDLHLLAVACQQRALHRSDTLTELLHASDRPILLDWLRQQHLAWSERGVLMVHAGVLPTWSAAQTLSLAAEVESMLRSPDMPIFLGQMYGNQPTQWRDELTGIERLRVTVNALTRLRFCSATGVMDFSSKEGAGNPPAGCMPWFDVPGRQSANVTVAFGHWSTLGWLDRTDVISLDLGCVWGGHLAALRLDEHGAHELFKIRCPQAQKPGD